MELAEPVKVFEGNGGDEKGGSGLALDDATHDIYVADTGNHRVDEFEADGTFVRAFGFGVLNGKNEPQVCTNTCQEGKSGSTPGEMETPLFVAVDNACALEERKTGVPLLPGECAALDPSNGDVYVGDTGDNIVTKFSEAGELENVWGIDGQLEGIPAEPVNSLPAEPFTTLYGIAISDTGNLWIDAERTGISAELFKFEQSGGYTMTHFPAEAQQSGLAINQAEELYVAEGAPNVRKFRSDGEPVGGGLGKLFPDGVSNFTGLSVDSANEDLYLDQESTIGVVEPGPCPIVKPGSPTIYCEISQSFAAPQFSGGAGLAVDPNGAVVYAANTAADEIDRFVEEPAAPPLLANESSVNVTATSAKLAGEVDPRSLEGEAETEYWFEYVTEARFAREGFAGAARTAAGTLAPSFDAVPVTAEVQNLEPNTAYRYRLVAKNAVGEGRGEELAFTTQGSGTFALPDDRQWELVSPVEKHGALIEPIAQEGIIQAAADGGAITYHANQATEPGAEGAVNQVQIFSSRGAGGTSSWSTRDIEPSHGATGKAEGNGETYRFFSENLAYALVQPAGAFVPGLYPEASEQSPLLRSNYLGDTSEQCVPTVDDCYQALVTRADDTASPSFVPFGEGEVRPGVFGPCPQANIFCGPQLVGASRDGQHPVFRSYAQLTSHETPPNSAGELYEWNHGTIAQVSILPNGEVPADAELGYGQKDTRNAVSPDGSRVVFTSGKVIYVRENAAQPSSPIVPHSTAVNGEQCEVPTDACTVEVGEGVFQTANSETTKIFFEIGENLYEYTIGSGKPPVPLTEEAKSPGGIEGTAIVGASENGEYVYFVANGTLKSAAEGAIAGNCTKVQSPGQLCNLYVEHNGVTKLVAVLSGEDRPDWAAESLNLTALTARVSPDGQYLAFMSDRDLVGYDTADARTGAPDEEVYEYAATTSRLACASCDPTGGRPRGHYYFNGGTEAGGQTMRLVGGSKIWEPSSSLAANIPGWTPYNATRAAYQSRYLSDEGRLFFNSYGALVPKDGNGNWDVYEYEPQGVPAGGEHPCAPESASGSVVFKPARTFQVPGSGGAPAVSGEEPEGCVGLISSGSSNEESAFLDASAGDGEGESGGPGSVAGGDVFFLTTAQLESQDTDTAYDIYDAHECTTASPCIPPPPSSPRQCETEASCKAPPTPQPGIYGPPPSATFNGLGNFTESPVVVKPKPLTRAQKLAAALKVCRRDKKRAKRTACEKQARKAYGPVKKAKKKG